jgi:hypothetical protein
VLPKWALNNRMHSDSKKRRSSFLFALLFASGDAERYRPKLDVSSGSSAASQVMGAQRLFSGRIRTISARYPRLAR